MESMSFKHSVHRISWVPIIACIAAGLFMIALFFIVGFHVFFEKMPLFLIECGLAGLFIYFGLFLWYQRLKKQPIHYNDEWITVDGDGHRIYWNEIESVQFSNVGGMKTTTIVPKKQCYKILKQRMGQHNLQKVYAFYWFYLERPKQLHDQIIQQWYHAHNNNTNHQLK